MQRTEDGVVSTDTGGSKTLRQVRASASGAKSKDRMAWTLFLLRQTPFPADGTGCLLDRQSQDPILPLGISADTPTYHHYPAV